MKNLQLQILATTANPLDRVNQVINNLSEMIWESAYVLWIIAILVVFVYRIFFRTRNKR